jgi:FkbM family methyltransferase
VPQLAVRAKQVLDKSGLRWVLCAAGSVRARLGGSDVRWISYRHGMWIYRLRSGFVVDRRFASVRSLEEFDSHTQDAWEYAYTPQVGDTVVDIGAGVGSEVHRFAELVGPSGLVVAVEANPTTCECLRLFCRLNELANVRVLNVAVSDSPGSVMISDDNEHHLSNSIVRTDGGVCVTCIRLDDLLDSLDIPVVDYLKMNIEGAESLAIAGMTGASERIAHVAIECHDHIADRGAGEDFRTKGAVEGFLVGAGFRVVTRHDARPWMRDQVNAENPRLTENRSAQ